MITVGDMPLIPKYSFQGARGEISPGLSRESTLESKRLHFTCVCRIRVLSIHPIWRGEAHPFVDHHYLDAY